MHTSAQALEGTLPQQPCDQVLGICRESFIPFWPHNFICKEKGTGVGGAGRVWTLLGNRKVPQSSSRGKASQSGKSKLEEPPHCSAKCDRKE